jgi:hypothetical protein
VRATRLSRSAEIRRGSIRRCVLTAVSRVNQRRCNPEIEPVAVGELPGPAIRLRGADEIFGMPSKECASPACRISVGRAAHEQVHSRVAFIHKSDGRSCPTEFAPTREGPWQHWSCDIEEDRACRRVGCHRVRAVRGRAKSRELERLTIGPTSMIGMANSMTCHQLRIASCFELGEVG